MKPRISTHIMAMTLLAMLALPTRWVAQEQKQSFPQYTVVDLGTLGGTFSLAGGLSDSGWVEGFSSLPGNTVEHGFVWRNGVMTDLGTLGGPNSVSSWPPSESGDATGGAETSSLDPLGEDFNGFGTHHICLPFFWRKGVKTPLPTLGGNNGFATEINNRAEVAGIAENTTREPTCTAPQVLQFKPVIWTKGGVQELPTFPGDPVGAAYAINDKSEAAGESGSCKSNGITSIPLHALLWQDGEVTDLGNLGGTMNNVAVDINNQGQVVGHSDLLGDLNSHAFLWQDGVMRDLGALLGDVDSDADGINSKGQVVGGSFTATTSRAYLWQNGVMTDLNTLIPSNSPLYLLEATGTINSKGQIAGIALVISSGEVHAFLATPNNGETADGNAAAAVGGETSERPAITLPENVRKLVEQRRHFARFKRGLIGLQ